MSASADSEETTGRYLDRVVEVARTRLPEEVFRYFRQGAAESVSADEAQEAWGRYRFVPRVLLDVTDVDPGTSLLGTPVRSPFVVAPTTLQRAAHPDGEVATASAVAAVGSLMVVSSNASVRFEQIAATGVPWWLQIYVTPDRRRTLPVVERAADAGARAVVLTADTPVVATKLSGRTSVWDVVDSDWLRVNFDDRADDPAVAEKATDLGPQDVAWLGDRSGLPVVVKGVLSPLDARRCVDAGAAAVWVSNHGGRQLDRVAATAEVLGEVSDVVGDAVEVYVDGGVRRGTDALTAGALGARAVFLGRPVLYGLAADGQAGVERVLRELEDELVEGMRLAGRTRFPQVGRDLLHGGTRPRPL